MARTKSGSGQPTGPIGNRDIRSFFGGRSTAKETQNTVISSRATRSLGASSTSPSSIAVAESPSDGALAHTQVRDVKATRQPQGKRKRSFTVQDENSKPGTEDLEHSNVSSTPPPHFVLPASGFLNTSTSLSEINTTPTLPSSTRQLLLSTPGHKPSKEKIVNDDSADLFMSASGRTPASARKVRFNSAPSTPGHSSEPDTTPVRLLFTGEKKMFRESPSQAPARKLLSPSNLPCSRRNGPLRTPKRDQTGQTSGNDTPNSLSPLPDLPSSPSIPPSPSTAKKRTILTRDAVIKGSDEEEDDSFSDCSLPDLDMLGPRKPRADPCGTPQAKRRAIIVHKSPLTIQPKHKFDFKTLDAHSKRHDVMFDSPKRPKNVVIEDEMTVEVSPSKSRQKLIEIAGVKTEEDADKALRAMERTHTSSSKNRWYFFTKDADVSHTSIPFPKKRSKGPWSFLEKPGTRDRHIMSGMPTTLAASLELPDELYFWVLNMASVERLDGLREEYCRLAAANKRQVKRLITPERLLEIFRQLGAANHVGDETLQPVQEVRDMYVDRDWRPLQSCLHWLRNIAQHLEYDAVAYGVKMLLRMAADKVVLENADMLMAQQLALGALVNNVEGSVWDDFCTEVCSSLYHGFDKSSLRILPLTCMPVTSPKLHELRRRLAVAFFLRDAALSSRHPDNAMSLRLVIARMKDSDFQVNRKTDYADLKAQVLLLDMAVDDGSFVPDKDDREHEKNFNAEIDDLAKRLKAIWRGINDTGAANLTRTEAKSVLEWVGQRLAYSVRTRPPPTQSIFGDQGPSSAKKKRQQDFMQKFVHSRKAKQTPDDSKEEEASSDEDATFVTAIG
ncbi:uncharacterized protein CTRU02_207436 [Colletotrichum truncatum]|uniref:Uncharacterized protein n=1 Tax=Colletotrichum truncatum TaxID=5467 RepID=A0ACC3Z0T7_COLTU|nr:uncharacterized protein CTRU02_00930 [Colletotrichum truncatum]KAF6800525.1 hypothetical protein CTRU02_00930 [Colletotrichum truncatum]